MKNSESQLTNTHMFFDKYFTGLQPTTATTSAARVRQTTVVVSHEARCFG